MSINNAKVLCKTLSIANSNIVLSDIASSISLSNMNICLELCTSKLTRFYLFKCVEAYHNILDADTINRICTKLNLDCESHQLQDIIKDEMVTLRNALNSADKRSIIKEHISTNMFTYSELIQAAENLEHKINKIKSIPNHLSCPLTHTLFIDPVNCSDGYTYERQAIEQWMKKSVQSPMTKEKMSREHYSNLSIQWCIDALCDSIC